MSVKKQSSQCIFGVIERMDSGLSSCEPKGNAEVVNPGDGNTVANDRSLEVR